MFEYNFEQLVDLDRVRSLLQTHHKITGVCSAILDLEQNILVAEGWEDICTRFHRVHSVTLARCLESNEAITHRLDEFAGEYRECKCKNGLWDIAMPIVIGGRMVATFFIGQFFYDDEEVDESFFRAQAAEFGFVEEPYIAALRRVPIFSREQIRNILDFYRDLIQVLAESGLKKLRLLQEAEERKKVEEALAAREREFRSLAENLPDSVARWDTNGRYLYLNPTLERALGVSAKDCIGQQSPERHTEVRAAVARVAASGRAEHSVRQEVMVGGASLLHDISLVPEFDEDGRVVSVLGIGRDLTDFYRMQETIAAREQEYRSLAESSPDHIIRYDREGRILYLNKALVQRLNLNAAEEVIGKRPSEIWPDGRFADIEQAAVRAMETGAIQTLDLSAPGVGGEVRSDHVLILPERDVTGQTIGSIAFGRDITERNKAEEQLALLNFAINRVQEAAYLIDSDGCFLYVNDEACRALGYSREELLGLTLPDIDPGYPREQFLAIWGELQECGSLTFEVTHKKKDGLTFPAEVNANYFKYAGNGYILALVRDITERKRIEDINLGRLRLLQFAANHTMEELLQATLDEVEVLTDSAIGFYHFLEPDQKTLSLQGWSTRTLAEFCKAEGKGLKYDVDQAGVWVDCVRQRQPVIHNDYASLPHRKGMPEGHPPVVRELVVPVMRGDKIVAILGVGNKPENYTDHDLETVSIFADLAWEIAERKQAEVKLELVDYALNHVHEAAFLIDEEARFHYVNREACGALGYSRDELIGLMVSDVDPEVSLEHWAEHWSKLKVSGSLTMERRHRKKNGDCFPVEINANYFEFDGQGYNLALVRDVTERKRIETELKNKNRELESFTYTVSHDLKSPLITIRGFAGAITSDLAAGRNDRIDKDLQRICNAADKMMTLMDDLLQLSRIGRVINPPEPVDMTCLAREVVENLSPILQQNGAQVSVQPEMPTVSCDRQRISEVLQNLVENAVQYRGEQSELQVQIGLREEGHRQVFFVQDNGAGIAPDYHQHVFGLFNRLNSQIPGNGIGLSLVKRIIEEHDGRVWVESDGEGAGSTFCFTLNCSATIEGERI